MTPLLRRHVPELDGIRGIAIILVLFVHFVGDTTAHNAIERTAVKLSNYGIWGVDLFFVLSGFLITGILADAKGSKGYYRNFYARRTLRIFPLYYSLLALLFLALPRSFDSYAPGLAVSRAHQGWAWSYLTNFYVAYKGNWALPCVNHFWSLAVEEHFYLFWPAVIALLSRRNAMRACVALGLFALTLRIVASLLGANELVSLVTTPCRLDSLCTGGWFALWIRGEGALPRNEPVRKVMMSCCAGVAGLSLIHVIFPAFDAATLPLRTTFISLTFGLNIVQVAALDGAPRLAAFLRWNALRLVGKYSYGLYVYHGIIAYFLVEHRTEEWLARLVGSHGLAVVIQASTGMAASFFVAGASYELYEKRFLALKRWFETRPFHRRGANVPVEATGSPCNR